MTEEQEKGHPSRYPLPNSIPLDRSHYNLLGLSPAAGVIEVRHAYRELSKLYHPDTTNLPTEIAIAKFQQLNEAYAILSNPERRLLYDLQVGYSRYNVIQAPEDEEIGQEKFSNSAYLDPNDRPLSGGELFALMILGLTFAGCLLLVVIIALTRGY